MNRTEEGVAMRDTQYVRRAGRKMSPGVDLAAQLKGQLEAMNATAAMALALPAAPVRPRHAFWGALAACGCPVDPIDLHDSIARNGMLMGCYSAILRESGVDVDALIGGGGC